MLGTRACSALLHPVLLPVIALVLGVLGVLTVLTTPADAATGPTLVLTGPATARRGSEVTLTATLTGAGGSPLADETVRFETPDGTGGWTPLTPQSTAATGPDGTAALAATLTGSTTYRAVRDAVGDGTGDGAAAVSPEITVRAYDAATSLVLAGPASGYVDAGRTLTATLTRQDTGGPVAGEQVLLQRRVDGAWRAVRTVATDQAGAASWSVKVLPSDDTFRAVYAGRYDPAEGVDALRASTSEPVSVVPLKRSTVLDLTGPRRVVDETSVSLRLSWRAGNGAPVPGSVVVQRRLAGGSWTRYATLALGGDGVARLRVRPRVDTRWRAVGAAGRWWKADTSPVLRIDNVPPGRPVAYPRSAPRPSITVPRNTRARGAGPNARISRISDAVWRSMVGRTWHAGCPVGRSQLRVVRVNYWGYDGYRYRGEIVLRDSVARRGAGLFASMYRQQLPIWRMYRVDRFGWSAYLHGGNDYRSMRAGNTSGFNCRGVTGNPGVPSPHSYGRSIDLNTWENPYRSRRGLVPNSWWQYHSHPRIAWRSRSHPVVRTMAAYGFRWTYGLGDTQHFDG